MFPLKVSTWNTCKWLFCGRLSISKAVSEKFARAVKAGARIGGLDVILGNTVQCPIILTNTR